MRIITDIKTFCKLQCVSDIIRLQNLCWNGGLLEEEIEENIIFHHTE